VTDLKETLFNQKISKKFTEAIFAESHGAFDAHLGAGGLYYALAVMVRAQVSVCIGSGGGYVPRLLWQAQQDLGLSNAQTYLVDANIPDLGFGHPMQKGGWLTPDNDLQEAAPDLTILQMLSRDAAQLFAAAGITIDYLHIDGDHSTRGVVADMSDYLPLLSTRAVISLHDVRAPSVQLAISEILGRHPALESITFGEIGNGTAILRRQASPPPPALPLTLRDPASERRTTRINLSTAAAEIERSQAKSRFERWHYLTTPTYRSRYDLIAGTIDRPDHTIVEVGGYPNSIVRHVTAARRVIAIEPYTPPEYVSEIQAAAAQRNIELLIRQGRLGEMELNTELLGPYALVALGLDVSAGCDSAEEFQAALHALVDLAGHATVAALEAPQYAPSQIALRYLCNRLRLSLIHDITLDLSQDPVADEFFVRDGRAKRRLVVFRPEQILPAQDGEGVLNGPERYFESLRAGLPVRVKPCTLGEPIYFRANAGAEGFLTSGWSNVEAEHVWGIGRYSTIELELAQAPKNPIRLELDLMPAFAPDVCLQRLAILINGTRLFKGDILSEGPCRIVIPHDVLARRRSIRIVLIHPDGGRPAELLANSRDTRLLSIGLRSMVLVDPS
jgi:hypothetical protein